MEAASVRGLRAEDRLLGEVRRELGLVIEQLDEAVKPGGYAQRYLACMLELSLPRPNKPPRMHGMVGALLRDVIEDVCACARERGAL